MQTGLYSTRLLRANGLTTHDVRRAVAAGTLTRPRRGWYATGTTPPEVITAARVGGRRTGLGALRLHGAWTLDQPELHVRVADGVAIRRVGRIHLHWTPQRIGPGVDTVAEALRSAISCADLRSLVIAIDSLANRGILGTTELRAVLDPTSRGRRAWALHDPAAESGIETLVRLGLRRHRIRVATQVSIAGVGRVDFLVGQRLVIEADGYDWHGDRVAFERDRERDRELVRRGYVVIRASYRQVTTDLDAVIVAVLAVVRRRDHRWRAVHRTELSESGYLVDVSSTDLRDSES